MQEGAEILGVSVDSVESHLKWAKELGGVNYPLLSDEDKTVSRLYDVLDENEGICLRATFIINPAGEITYFVLSHTMSAAASTKRCGFSNLALGAPLPSGLASG